MFEGLAETTRGFAMAAIGLFHVEVVVVNGGVSCAQSGCDVDEHVILSRVAQMSCRRQKHVASGR